MRDLVTMVRDWWTVKTAKNPNPDLESRIREERTRLHENVALIRLTNIESKRNRIEQRWDTIEDLIHDVARH